MSILNSPTLSGDVSGKIYSITVDKIKGTPVSSTTPTSGQALVFDGTNWAPSTITAGTAGQYLSSSGGTLTGGLTGTNATFNLLSATKFYGDGSSLTGVTAGSYLSSSGGTLTGGLTGTVAVFNSYQGDGSQLVNIQRINTETASVSCGATAINIKLNEGGPSTSPNVSVNWFGGGYRGAIELDPVTVQLVQAACPLGQVFTPSSTTPQVVYNNIAYSVVFIEFNAGTYLVWVTDINNGVDQNSVRIPFPGTTIGTPGLYEWENRGNISFYPQGGFGSSPSQEWIFKKGELTCPPNNTIYSPYVKATNLSAEEVFSKSVSLSSLVYSNPPVPGKIEWNGTHLAIADNLANIRRKLGFIDEKVKINNFVSASNQVNDFYADLEEIHYYSIPPSSNFTINLIAGNIINPTSFFNTINGQTSKTICILNQSGTTAYKPTLTIDGAAQTVLWQGGISTGTANALDVWTFTVIRTSSGSSPSYVVLGSVASYYQ